MARFTDLANEIILLISNLVQPPDLDNFFLTSKHVRELNQSRISEHLETKKKYKRIRSTFFGSNTDLQFGNWAEVLKDVLILPRIAAYVETLDILRWYSRWASISLFPNERKEVTLEESNQKVFDEALQKAGYGLAAEQATWKRLIEKGSEEFIVVFLLTLLPNISSLMLTLPVDHEDLFNTTLECVALDPKPRTLTMLTRVTISAETRQVPLHLIETFAALPSMRQIHADKIAPERHIWNPKFKESMVTTLRLRQCSIGPETLSEFLFAFGSLVEFEYSHAKETSNGAEYKPFWIINALKSNKKHSLMKLTLRGHIREADKVNMGSLGAFEVLEELETDLEPLYEPPEDEHSYGWPELPDMLPASIRKIVLYQNYSPNVTETMSLVEDILPPEHKALPSLESLAFRFKRQQDFEIPLRIVDALGAVGIVVSSI